MKSLSMYVNEEGWTREQFTNEIIKSMLAISGIKIREKTGKEFGLIIFKEEGTNLKYELTVTISEKEANEENNTE